MTTSQIVTIALAAYLVLTGLAGLVTGKNFSAGSMVNRYTEESIAKTARLFSMSNLVSGVALLLYDFLPARENVLFSIGSFDVKVGLVCLLGGFVIAAVCSIIAMKHLVKK